MVAIKYPQPEFRIKTEAGREYIFDPQRRKWLVLTPEEWVRQNFIQYLVKVRNYPPSLIAIEKQIRLGPMVKRFDILVYDREHKPWMMVECKGMEVPLSQDVLQQVLRYNLSLPVPYLLITNGTHCFATEKKNGRLEELPEIPEHC